MRPDFEHISDQKIDQWMVRTAQNEVRGPFTREAVIQQIQSGQLGPEDEVCQANRYWIYLDEREEVMKQLGIEAPRKNRLPEDDATDTDTQSDMRTQEIIYHRPLGGQGAGGAQSDQNDIPDLSGETGGSPSVLSNRALRQFQPRAGGGSAAQQRLDFTPAPRPFVLGAVERPSILKWIFTILLALLIGLVGLVIYVLRFSR